MRECEVPTKDANGNVIIGIVEQIRRWKSHFEFFLTKEERDNLKDIPVSDEDLEINTDKLKK